MRKDQGNISLSLALGVVGVMGALYQFGAVNKSVRELDRKRISAEGDAQVISNLNRYKGLLSSNGVNAFALYPEPYLKANTRLEQFSGGLAFNSSFNKGSQTVNLVQPQARQLTEADMSKIMNGSSKVADVCKTAQCPQSSIRLLGFNRDVSGPIPERIVSADVEVNTQVIDAKTGRPVQKKIVAQVPLEAPKVTSATLTLNAAASTGSTKGFGKADFSQKVAKVVVDVPELTAELVVGGVAVAGEITIKELNKTFSSDDKDQWGLDAQGFPKHGAVTIKNTGASLVKTPTFKVEDGTTYSVVGRMQSLDENAPNPEIRLMVEVKLPPPPDPSICASQCADKGLWYDGPFVGGATGAYSSMVKGKWSCMFNQNNDWENALGYPVYSFNPKNGCKKEGPTGKRTKEMGCFVGETLIRMADMSQREIAALLPGDKVWNPLLKKAMLVKRIIVGPEEKSLLRIRYAGRRDLLVTDDHPFMNRFGTVVPAKELQEILTEEGVSPVSLSFEQPAEVTNVYNLELEAGSDVREHFVEANGSAAGDLFLQNQLKREKNGIADNRDLWSELKTDFSAN